MTPDRARAVTGAAYPLPIKFVDATLQRCCHAAGIKAKDKLYYVDSFAAALAVANKATLVTSDSDFRRLGTAFLWFGLSPDGLLPACRRSTRDAEVVASLAERPFFVKLTRRGRHGSNLRERRLWTAEPIF